jgi:hypothetical protein
MYRRQRWLGTRVGTYFATGCSFLTMCRLMRVRTTAWSWSKRQDTRDYSQDPQPGVSCIDATCSLALRPVCTLSCLETSGARVGMGSSPARPLLFVQGVKSD